MTYLVLARKWRPRSFDTLVGQDHVVRALTHALETQRLHHAWLFTGTRGVGKTTLSRILAKSLNCEKGVTAHPCGECRACTEIDAGRYVDYVELDAASNRGVDEMTQLLEQAVYAPSSARFKVYMIDEVHMLTGHAFNAMLKTLEEPPPHVKFILATTDPQKIPVTVLSRCLQFNLKHMTVDAIVAHLSSVLTEEGMAFEAPALRLLGQAAGGSMRDALSLTDQAIAYSAGNLTLEAVQGMLGTIDQRHLLRLVRALAAHRAADVLAVADELAARGLSYSGALADLSVLLSHIAIQQRVPGALPPDDPMAADIESLAAALHPDLVQLYYSIAVHSRSELALAPDEYAGFVMACLRMLALTPEGNAPIDPPPSRGRETALKEPAAPVKPEGEAPAAREAAPAKAAQSRPEPAPVEAAQSRPEQARAPVSATEAAVEAPDDGPEIPAWEPLPDEPEPSAAQETVAVEMPADEPSTNEVPGAAPEAASESVPQSQALSPRSESLTEPELEPEPTPASVSASDPAADIPDNLSDDIPAEAYDFPPADSDYLPAEMPVDGEWEPVMGDDDFSASSLAPLPRETPAATTQRPRLARMTAQDWPALAASLPLTGLAAELARQSEWVGVDGDCITLRVAIRSLAARQGQARLRTVLTEHFGKVVQLAVEFGATGSDTAHAVEQARRAERQKEAEAAVANDPFVLSLIEEFGARVMPGSIAALDNEKAA